MFINDCLRTFLSTINIPHFFKVKCGPDFFYRTRDGDVLSEGDKVKITAEKTSYCDMRLEKL